MDLIDILQKINQDGLNAASLTDLAIGTVNSASPLQITLQTNMQPLREEVLYLTEAVLEKKLVFSGTSSIPQFYINGENVPSSGNTVYLNQSLAVGDKVLMLRVQKGQKFIVISKIY